MIRIRPALPLISFPQRVQVPNNLVLGFWAIVIIMQVLGEYMIIRYLDPQGLILGKIEPLLVALNPKPETLNPKWGLRCPVPTG